MSFGLTPRRQAILWGSIGTAMLLFTLWKPWFVVHPFGFAFPLGVLFLVYGGLQLVIHLMTRTRVLLTDEEVERWGKQLELATPIILDELQKGRSMKVVAQRAEQELGVPPDITNRYTIALLRSVKQEHRELLIPREEKSADKP